MLFRPNTNFDVENLLLSKLCLKISTSCRPKFVNLRRRLKWRRAVANSQHHSRGSALSNLIKRNQYVFKNQNKVVKSSVPSSYIGLQEEQKEILSEAQAGSLGSGKAAAS